MLKPPHLRLWLRCSGSSADTAARAAYLEGMNVSPHYSSQPQPQPVPGLEPTIDIDTLAHYLGVPVSTVYDCRTKRRGPVGYRFGKHVMFALSDVQVWIAQQRDPARAGSALHGG